MSFKNQIADSFDAFSVYIMDYFYNQVSLLKGGITKHKMDKKNIGKGKFSWIQVLSTQKHQLVSIYTAQLKYVTLKIILYLGICLHKTTALDTASGSSS